MRPILNLIIATLSILATSTPVSSQLQRGIVRTQERPDARSKPLARVIMKFKGLNNKVVSDTTGAFSLETYTLKLDPGQRIILDSAIKKDYRLAEQPRVFSRSESVPIYVTMIDLKANKKSVQRSAETLSASTKKAYNGKKGKLKLDYSQKKIKAEEYQQHSEQLQQSHEKTTLSIPSIAEHYAATDYMGLDSLTRKATAAIERGDIDLAASIMARAGDLSERCRTLLARERQIRDLQAGSAGSHEQSAAMEDLRQAKKSLDQMLYNKATLAIITMQHPDSATHYLAMRADLDELNIGAQLDAADRFLTTHANYGYAYRYIQRGLDSALKYYGKTSANAAACFNMKGKLFYIQQSYTDALSCFREAFEIRRSLSDVRLTDLAESYSNIGITMYWLHQTDSAEIFLNKAVALYQELMPQNSLQLATAYDNLGPVYTAQKRYDEAIRSHMKCLDIKGQTLGKDHPSYGMTLNNIGLVYSNMGDYDNAIKYIGQGLEIIRNSLGNTHRKTILLENNLRDCENLKRLQNGQ